MFKIKIFVEELLFRSRYFYRVSKFFKKATFSKKLILQKRYLLRIAIFQRNYFLETAYFSEKQYSAIYFFGRGTFTQMQFLSTAKLLIYKLIQFTLVSNVQEKRGTSFLSSYYCSNFNS